MAGIFEFSKGEFIVMIEDSGVQMLADAKEVAEAKASLNAEEILEDNEGPAPAKKRKGQGKAKQKPKAKVESKSASAKSKAQEAQEDAQEDEAEAEKPVNRQVCSVKLSIPGYKYSSDSAHEAKGMVKLLGIKASRPSEAVLAQKKADLEASSSYITARQCHVTPS